jgi:hypothetical protein
MENKFNSIVNVEPGETLEIESDALIDKYRACAETIVDDLILI